MKRHPKPFAVRTAIVTAFVFVCVQAHPAQSQSTNSSTSPSGAQNDAAAAALVLFRAQDWAGAATAYATLTKAEPQNGGHWFRLGSSYHQLKRYREAISALERARELGTAPVFTAYNLACAHALAGDKDPAFDYLAEAIDAGFQQINTIQTDTDLDALRDDARFGELVARVEALAYPCKVQPEHHKLDFWIGEWDVYVNGQLAGRNDIASVADGCALTESWENVGNIEGVSLNYYDNVIGKYKQIWVASASVTEYIEVSSGEGSIVLVATTTAADGTESLSRLSFTKQGKNVRQLFESSNDKGETWTPGFDGLYVPRGTKPE